MATRPTLRRGDHGPEVYTLQTCLGVKPADGDFGPITENAVKDFQRKNALSADGIVGPMTWAKLEDVYQLPPYEPPPPPAGSLSADQVARITTLARNSAVQRYNWKGRGIMPPGYCKGMAVAYGCAVRKFYAGHAAFKEIAKANSHSADKDVLAWYAGTFDAASMSNNAGGITTLRHVYVFLMGLGMRESSGRHCEGRDYSATNTSSVTCEAGAWQTSWNAKSCAPTILQGLFDEYKKGAEGYLSIFKEGVFCSTKSWQNYGAGDGLKFQDMSKRQPMFACEVAAIVIRKLRKHYGPINRREVELRKEANDLLRQVDELVAPVTARA